MRLRQCLQWGGEGAAKTFLWSPQKRCGHLQLLCCTRREGPKRLASGQREQRPPFFLLLLLLAADWGCWLSRAMWQSKEPSWSPGPAFQSSPTLGKSSPCYLCTPAEPHCDARGPSISPRPQGQVAKTYQPPLWSQEPILWRRGWGWEGEGREGSQVEKGAFLTPPALLSPASPQGLLVNCKLC